MQHNNTCTEKMYRLMCDGCDLGSFKKRFYSDDKPMWENKSSYAPTPPLFYSVIFKRREITKFLLDNGANPNWRVLVMDMALIDWADNEDRKVLLSHGAALRKKPRLVSDNDCVGY